eukprot:1017153-Pleurochrysis_carterae.AAC.1
MAIHILASSKLGQVGFDGREEKCPQETGKGVLGVQRSHGKQGVATSFFCSIYHHATLERLASGQTYQVHEIVPVGELLNRVFHRVGVEISDNGNALARKGQGEFFDRCCCQ